MSYVVFVGEMLFPHLRVYLPVNATVTGKFRRSSFVEEMYRVLFGAVQGLISNIPAILTGHNLKWQICLQAHM